MRIRAESQNLVLISLSFLRGSNPPVLKYDCENAQSTRKHARMNDEERFEME